MPTRNPLTCDLTPFCDCEQVANSPLKTTLTGRGAQSSIKGECCPVRRDCATLRFFPLPPPCASLARAYSLSLGKSTYGIHMQPSDSPEKPLCSVCVPCSLLMKVIEIAQDSLGCWCRLCTYAIPRVLRVRQRTWAMRISTHRAAHDGVRLALPARRSRDSALPTRAPVVSPPRSPATGWRPWSGSMRLPVPLLTLSFAQVDPVVLFGTFCIASRRRASL